MDEIGNVSFDAGEINKIIGRKQLDNWQGMTSIAGKPADDVIEYIKQQLV